MHHQSIVKVHSGEIKVLTLLPWSKVEIIIIDQPQSMTMFMGWLKILFTCRGFECFKLAACSN